MANISKGQSAIEYLTTYGWMLLVVAIVGGAIFSTVQNSSQVQTTSGLANADVQVNDFGVTSQGFQAELRAGTSDQIENVNFTLTDPETGETVSQETTAVPVGDTETVSLDNVKSSESTNTYDVKIQYDTGGLEDLEEEGTITGNIILNTTEDGENGEEGSSLTLMQTVNYTYDNSGDVQVNEITAGAEGYQVNLNGSNEKTIHQFENDVEEINIVEMHGADGGNGKAYGGTYDGGSGGLIKSYRFEVGQSSTLQIWVGERGGGEFSGEGGWGRSEGGSGGEVYPGEYSGGGGGSTEIWSDSSEMIAAVDAGGGGQGQAASTYDGGGGARGGQGYNNAEGSGFGGDGEGVDPPGQGGQEINDSLQIDSGSQVSGGSDEGSGWILLEYYG